MTSRDMDSTGEQVAGLSQAVDRKTGISNGTAKIKHLSAMFRRIPGMNGAKNNSFLYL